MTFKLTKEQLDLLITKARDLDLAKVEATLAGSKLFVSISKWGTSTLTTLTFSVEDSIGVVIVNLIKEDVAWLHKKYIPQFMKAISDLVTEVGGVVV